MPPQNFENTYEGVVPAHEALYRSLNIPFVLLLRQYGISRFYQQLRKHRLYSINRHPDHYGLSLILGGAESSLWELSQAYAHMGFELNHYNQKHSYLSQSFQPLSYLPRERNYGKEQQEKTHLSAGAIYKTLEALTQVNRPSFDSAWRYYASSRKISWKTGTSFGNRDAWSIGMNANYLVGVWGWQCLRRRTTRAHRSRYCLPCDAGDIPVACEEPMVCLSKRRFTTNRSMCHKWDARQ